MSLRCNEGRSIDFRLQQLCIWVLHCCGMSRGAGLWLVTGSWPLKMVPIGCPETSVTKLHDVTENLGPQINLFCTSFQHTCDSFPEASPGVCLYNILVTWRKRASLAVWYSGIFWARIQVIQKCNPRQHVSDITSRSLFSLSRFRRWVLYRTRESMRVSRVSDDNAICNTPTEFGKEWRHIHIEIAWPLTPPVRHWENYTRRESMYISRCSDD